MKHTIAMIMTSIFILWFLFQPFYTEVYHWRNIVVEDILHEATKKAAVEGYYTPQIIEEMKEQLRQLQYTDSEIEFVGTTSIKGRGEIIEGRLSVPEGEVWFFPGLFPDTTTKAISKYQTAMSEKIL